MHRLWVVVVRGRLHSVWNTGFQAWREGGLQGGRVQKIEWRGAVEWAALEEMVRERMEGA